MSLNQPNQMGTIPNKSKPIVESEEREKLSKMDITSLTKIKAVLDNDELIMYLADNFISTAVAQRLLDKKVIFDRFKDDAINVVD